MCLNSKCALSGMSRPCRHRIKLGDKENYYYISPSSRARVRLIILIILTLMSDSSSFNSFSPLTQITAVCNFFTYIRYIQQGLVRQEGIMICLIHRWEVLVNVCKCLWSVCSSADVLGSDALTERDESGQTRILHDRQLDNTHTHTHILQLWCFIFLYVLRGCFTTLYGRSVCLWVMSYLTQMNPLTSQRPEGSNTKCLRYIITRSTNLWMCFVFCLRFIML